MRILLVEDDRDLCVATAALLRREGYEVDLCEDGAQALFYLRQRIYDMCILDRMLPELDGLHVLHTARTEGIDTPVLMMTAMGRVGDRVEGLDAGADDYLVKPFDARELLARVRARARRPGAIRETPILMFGDLALDPTALTLQGGKGSCTLSKKESEVLAALIQSAGQTLTRTMLFGKVWGPDAAVEEAGLDSYIHFVRRRLKATSGTVTVATVRGVGYRLVETL